MRAPARTCRIVPDWLPQVMTSKKRELKHTLHGLPKNQAVQHFSAIQVIQNIMRSDLLLPSMYSVEALQLSSVPTPPGTGVMWLAMGSTASKSTSPTRRYPRSRVSSSTRLMPTSMTTAPGFTMSAGDEIGPPNGSDQDVGLPGYASGRSFVRLWQTVTVASIPFLSIRLAKRLPDDVGPPDNHAVLGHAVSMPERRQHLNNSRRRGWLKAVQIR